MSFYTVQTNSILSQKYRYCNINHHSKKLSMIFEQKAQNFQFFPICQHFKPNPLQLVFWKMGGDLPNTTFFNKIGNINPKKTKKILDGIWRWKLLIFFYMWFTHIWHKISNFEIKKKKKKNTSFLMIFWKYFFLKMSYIARCIALGDIIVFGHWKYV